MARRRSRPLRQAPRGRVRQAIAAPIPVRPGETVLETSIGTGLNLPLLPREATYYGIDLSMSMLRRCQDNLALWIRQAHLALANAEALPFKSDSFDTVYHVGGINTFDDKEAAIREMVRVAKPGGQIVIEDESARVLVRLGLSRRLRALVAPPLSMLPPGMEDVRCDTLFGESSTA